MNENNFSYPMTRTSTVRINREDSAEQAAAYVSDLRINAGFLPDDFLPDGDLLKAA